MTAVRTRDRVLPGRQGRVPVRDYLPDRPRAGAAALIWLHGGGFFSGHLDQAESHRVALRLAATGRTVRAVDYRLAPKVLWGRRFVPAHSPNRYPAALDDVVDAATALGAEHDRVVLGGASAGACLAVTAAQRLMPSLPQPGSDAAAASGAAPEFRVESLLLCYGVYHAELPPLPESVRLRVRGLAGYRQFTPAAVARMNLNYVGRAELLHSGAFPGGGDLTGLPPTLLLDADHDTLRASGEAFGRELGAAGVDTEYAVVPHAWHGYLNRHKLGGFRYALTTMTRWLDRRGL